MNQILSMNGGMEPQNNRPTDLFGGGNNNNNRGGTFDTKTSVMIFAIVLIVFGVAMLSVGAFNLISSLSGNGDASSDWPRFEAEQDENTLIVTISDIQIIDKVAYHWNNDFEKEIQGDGLKHFMVTLDVPAGTNTLSLTSTDINGKETTYQKTFIGTEAVDNVKPELDLSIIGSKLNIVAKTTTDTPLAYVTYKWDDGQETRVDATLDKSMIETQTTIQKGTHTVVITAVKENGVSQTETKTFTGSLKPTITVNQVGTSLKVTLEHDSGIQSADIKFNGRNVVLSSDRFGAEHKTVEFTLNIKSAQENTLTITATSVEGSVETYNGVAQG